jgi:hypothetical protein
MRSYVRYRTSFLIRTFHQQRELPRGVSGFLIFSQSFDGPDLVDSFFDDKGILGYQYFGGVAVGV